MHNITTDLAHLKKYLPSACRDCASWLHTFSILKINPKIVIKSLKLFKILSNFFPVFSPQIFPQISYKFSWYYIPQNSSNLS